MQVVVANTSFSILGELDKFMQSLKNSAWDLVGTKQMLALECAWN